MNNEQAMNRGQTTFDSVNWGQATFESAGVNDVGLSFDKRGLSPIPAGEIDIGLDCDKRGLSPIPNAPKIEPGPFFHKRGLSPIDWVLLVVLSLVCMIAPAGAERIKDLANIQGVRGNALIGYGLVVGLDGTGDQTTQTPFTVQSITSMLSQMGVTLPPGISLQLKNVAAVMVTAQLPAFAQPGQTLDITVSSLGNAKSLRGGTLLLTPLKGPDGQLYALAQGSVAVGGAGASAGGSKTQINTLNAGRIPGGATVERAVASNLGENGILTLELREGDFGVARQAADALNQRFGAGSAEAVDARMIRVRAPAAVGDRVAFVAEMEMVAFDLAMPAAKVIVNARTGSIVMNQTVTLAACAVAHGNLTVTIQNNQSVSQPGPLSNGQTVVTDTTKIDIKQDSNALTPLAAGAKLTDVVRVLNTLGATPGDLIAILQAMKAAGALRAEIEII